MHMDAREGTVEVVGISNTPYVDLYVKHRTLACHDTQGICDRIDIPYNGVAVRCHACGAVPVVTKGTTEESLIIRCPNNHFGAACENDWTTRLLDTTCPNTPRRTDVLVYEWTKHGVHYPEAVLPCGLCEMCTLLTKLGGPDLQRAAA